VAIAALGCAVLLAATSVVLIQFPVTDEPTAVDAIIVLGEPDDYSMGEAEKLVRDGVSDQLVISTPFGEPGDVCRNPPARLTVTCFIPDPLTTRGEAQEIGRLAEQHGWTSIAVVTWPTHVSRSRMLIGRCFDGDLAMVSYDDHMGTQDRINENLYQSGAFLKAFVQPGC
jgi:hypothetical protein